MAILSAACLSACSSVRPSVCLSQSFEYRIIYFNQYFVIFHTKHCRELVSLANGFRYRQGSKNEKKTQDYVQCTVAMKYWNRSYK